MEEKFYYQTGKIIRDFKIVREWSYETGYTKCRLSGLPCYVGGDRCRKCSHYGGLLPIDEIKIDGFYIRCDHPEQKDSDNIEMVKHAYNEWLRRKAMIAYCD